MHEESKVGDEVFGVDGAEVCGAVRQVEPHSRPEIVFSVENAGDCVGPLEAIQAAQVQKVIVDCNKLEQRLHQAIGHAHDAEEPGA
jgi:hypothetical protein